MSEIASFTNITKEAFQVVRERRALWWFAIPVGIFIGISSLSGGTVERIAPQDTTDAALWFGVLRNGELFFVLGLAFTATLCQSALRGPLILQIEHGLRSRETPADPKPGNPWSESLRAARIAVTFEATYWIFLFVVGLILSLPSFLAWRFNPPVLPAIIDLGLLLLLTLGVYLHFVKELSLFYALLGRVRFATAINLGFRLLRRQAFNVALFFSYAALLVIVFTLLIGSLFGIFGLSPAEPTPRFHLLAALPLGCYFIFDQALRLVFFRTIATSPKKPAEKVTTLEVKESPSGIASN